MDQMDNSSDRNLYDFIQKRGSIAMTDIPCGFWSDINMEFSHSHKKASMNLEDVVRNNLEKKYLTSRDYYNSKVITDVVYNENTNMVSVFKDYLIYDDVSEFLKRYAPSNQQ